MKRILSLALACLAIFTHPVTANGGFDPAKVIIIKADDYSGNFNSQQQKWTDFVNASRDLGIKVGLGVIPARVPAGNAAADWMQQQQALGDVEFWNHGWDHSRDPADPPTYWEFRNTPLADQQEHFADAQAWLLAATDRAAIAFGAPYNQTDANTMTVMNGTPAIRLFFTYNGATARSQGLVARVHTIGIIAESGGTGKPVASTFINSYPNGPAGPVSLQFHPAAFTAADLAEYEQIVGFLQGEGYTFMLPEEYIAAAVPEGAKVWTGATDTNWTEGNNWLPTGAPASGADVAFDGSGANLNTSTGAAFTLNSITLTSGQTSQVTINTTPTNSITFNPGAPLTVAAGSHQLAGTGTSGTDRDVVFTGAAGTDSYTLAIGGSANFEIQGRIGALGTGFGTRTYTKTGTGTLVFAGNSGGSSAWQHGGFTIQQGVLRLAAINAGGNSANNYIVSSGAALELDGSFNQTINNGTYTLNGTGIGGSGALRSLSGTKSITGSGTGGVNLATNASIGVDAGNLTIIPIIKGPGSLTKIGDGTLTLSGANTYTGATIISVGTLALGASEVLPATQVSLGDAALTVGAGFAETTGRLDITGAATLNLGDSNSTIAFADKGDLLDWTGTLDITGSFVPNVSVRFGTAAAGLTAAQLAKITVNGVGGYTLNAAGYLGEPVAVVAYTYVDATPTNTTLNGAPLVDRNTNPTAGNYFNESTGSAGTGTDGFWSYRTGAAFASFEGAACFESDSANVSGDAEDTPPLVTTLTMATPGTYDIVVLFSRNSNRDIAARIGAPPTTTDIFTTANAWNANQNLTPEPEIVFDSSYTNSRGNNTGAAYLGQVITTTPGQSVSVYVNGFDSLAGTQDERTQYEGVGFRPADANPPPEPKHYDVYLIAGQSNADGRGYVSDLNGPLAPYAGQQPDVKIFYVNPINKDPVNPTWNTGWRTLEPGYSVFGTTPSLPATRFGIEVSLGKALAVQDPERNVAFIKVSQGGTSLANDWDPAGGANYMWQTFANKVPEALAALTANGDTAEIRGMFWHQGESDGSNPTFQSDLVEFIAACRTLTGKPNLPFAIGELERDDVTPDIKGRTYQLTAMANVAAADPNTFVVSSEGLLTYDGTHFTSAAYITFGERYATDYHDYLDGLAGTGSFESWAGDEAITFVGDANSDGIADGMAWLLGAEFPAANAAALLPTPTENTGALEVTFTMRNLAARGAALLSLQYGTDLGAWSTVTIPEETGTHGGVGFDITPDGTLNHVTAMIPDATAPDGRLFIRLAGTRN